METNTESARAIEIRVLSESDVDAFWKLRLRALKEEPESFGAAYEEEFEKSTAEIAKGLVSSDDSFVLGAFVPSLEAMIGFYRRPRLKLRHTGTIWGMYVTPEYRGSGLGKALVSALIERAATFVDLEQLVLTVVVTNEAARRLYLSQGFKSYGIEPKALKIGSEYLDEELMVLSL